MGPVTISERFVAQCSPVISSNYDTCGTVTRATVAHLTADALTALFTSGGLFADLDAWFLHSIEMKACGVQRYAMYDWIMANADREAFRSALTGIKGVKTPSLLQPFIFGRQETVVNKNYWKVTAGYTNGAYDALNSSDGNATYPLSAAEISGADRIVRLESRFGVPTDENFFRVRDNLHIWNRKADGTTQHGQWRVLGAAHNSDLTYCDVAVVSVNAGSNEPYDATPSTGVVVIGVNNVNDFERWCQNLPTIDPRKRVPFWMQTFREARCVDSEYKAVYKRLHDSNPAFREFGDLPLAERNRQDEMENQKRFVHSFFFNKPISTNQTVNLWESLEAINTIAGSVLDVGLSGKLIARRANFIGVREQLRLCDRVFDLANNKLNLYEFLNLNYDIKRARETQGRSVKELDWFTDSQFAADFASAYVAYQKAEYGDILRATVPAEGINSLDQVWTSYVFKRPAGIKINIIVDKFFDDRVDEFEAREMGSAGRLLVCLDIGKPGPNGGTIYWAQIAANRKVHTTADIDQQARLDSTYRCVMNALSLEQTLKSETGTAVVECPLASAWIEGIKEGVPITTGRTPNNSAATPAGYYNLY